MDTLLSLAFDNISAKDLTKVAKGLRQIRGVLENICVQSTSLDDGSDGNGPDVVSPLAALEHDRAFREFFRLQERFEWNVATRLVTTLDRLLGVGPADLADNLIYSALYLLQGCLILHPPSRSLFEREMYMTLLIDLLDPIANPLHTQAVALSTITCALLHRPRNMRVFEDLGGLRTLCLLLNHHQNRLNAAPGTDPVLPPFATAPHPDTNPHAPTTSADVRARVLEFISIYITDEPKPDSSRDHTGHRRALSVQTSPSPHNVPSERQTKSATQKRRLLAQQLSDAKVTHPLSPSLVLPPTPTSAVLTDDEAPSRRFWGSKLIPATSSKHSAAGSSRSDDSGFGSSGSSWGSKLSPTGTTGYNHRGLPVSNKPSIDVQKAKRTAVGGGAVLELLEDEIMKMSVGVGGHCP